MDNLHGKCVLLGVTGGIAAYKMANVASALRKMGAGTHVIMTENVLSQPLFRVSRNQGVTH